jgi:hypothetical protein
MTFVAQVREERPLRPEIWAAKTPRRQGQRIGGKDLVVRFVAARAPPSPSNDLRRAGSRGASPPPQRFWPPRRQDAKVRGSGEGSCRAVRRDSRAPPWPASVSRRKSRAPPSLLGERRALLAAHATRFSILWSWRLGGLAANTLTARRAFIANARDGIIDLRSWVLGGWLGPPKERRALIATRATGPPISPPLAVSLFPSAAFACRFR